MNTDGPAISQMRRPQPREHVTRPACYGDPRFTTTDPVDAMEAAEICRTVCTFKVCREVTRDLTPAERANREGTWDGALYVGGRRRPAPGAIIHGSVSGARAHRARGEKPCDPCRLAESARRLENKRKREEAAS